MITITAVGGYGEVGRNMTCVTVGDESIVLDMGYHMDNLLKSERKHPGEPLLVRHLHEDDVLADDSILNKSQVKAIIPSHGHLDHIGGIPFMAKSYHAPIHCTPYTAQVLKRQFSDSHQKIKNSIYVQKWYTKFRVGENFEVEFIPITHSIPDSSLILIHTKYGTVCYANDFKLDWTPTLGKKPDLERLKRHAGDVKVLVSECLKAQKEGHTGSEQYAKEMLEELLMSQVGSNKGLFITTFSSHVERIQTIVRLAKKLNRKVILMGRSLEKYLTAAKIANVSDVIEKVELYSYRYQVRGKLKRLQHEDLSKYIIMMTGHQAEENAVLNAMLHKGLPNVFKKGDVFVFSCDTIPTESIIAARAVLEKSLKNRGLELYKNIHVSGHASKEDLRDLLTTLNPEHVIPSHGTKAMMDAYKRMAKEEGYIYDDTLHYLFSGEAIEFE